MANMKWTNEQLNAIYGNGGDILVSAAAGSGKTAVLTERVIEKITDEENPVNIDTLLIVTFTNAAAEEMKQRIQKKLWDLIEKNTADQNLQKQLLLVDSAPISTIHSFCIQLLRSNFHTLGLSAEFSIGDEKDLTVMQKKLIKELLENYYEEKNDDFLQLIELLAASKNDRKIEEIILNFYKFLRNHPFYNNWLKAAERNYSSEIVLENTDWYKIIMNYVTDALNYCKELVTYTDELCSTDSDLYSFYEKTLKSDITLIDNIILELNKNDWDKIQKAINNANFARLNRTKDYEDEEFKKKISDLRSETKATIKTLKEKIFIITKDTYKNDNVYLEPLVKILFRMVMDFDKMYSKAKLEKNQLDFNDLEHYTLKLLYTQTQDGYILTEESKHLKKQYSEVLIDEYQDTNETQEMIFEAISNNNRFLVGDVKQSIYRFRQARPENFLAKKNNYTPFNNKDFPAKIMLSANFRTRQESTELINYICQDIFNESVGEMNYLSEDMLYSKGQFDYTTKKAVELLITDKSIYPEKNSNIQAKIVADKINTMLKSKVQIEYVTKNEENENIIAYRDIEPNDICILMRSRTAMPTYTEELGKYGIAAVSDAQDEFLTSYEIAPIISYLKILQNPMLNFELCEVLSSYLYGFSSEMLANLRMDKSKNVFTVLMQEENKNNENIAEFLSDYALLRNESVSRKASEILQMIYTLTSAENKITALSGGDMRLANLRLLLNYADTYSNSYDIGSFVTYIYNMEDVDCDLEAAQFSSKNSVKIMTIHKSKGLEFPVVILAETETSFNNVDLRESVILNATYGAAFKLKNTDKMIQHKTLPYIALSIENQRAMLSEEIRILYVALTRAKQYLIISADDNKLSTMHKYATLPYINSKINPWNIRAANNFYSWIIMSLVHHPQFNVDIEGIEPIINHSAANYGELTVSVPQIDTQNKSDGEKPQEKNIAIDYNKSKIIEDNISWQYPFEEDTKTPVKFSVSSLSKGEYEEQYYFNRKPKIFTNQKSLPTERGTATHKFMQYVDFKQMPNNIDKELKRMVDKKFLTENEAKLISKKMLFQLFTSDFGKRILNSSYIKREMRFMYKYTRDELENIIGKNTEIGDTTVIQGASDCILYEDDGLVLIDYKTDFATDINELKEKYAIQIELYKDIIQRILGKKVKEKIIFSFYLNTAIEI